MEFSPELITKINDRIRLFIIEVKSITAKNLTSARLLSIYRSKLIRYSIHVYGDINSNFIQQELQTTIHKIEPEVNGLPTGTIEIFSSLIDLEIAELIFDTDSQLKIFDGDKADKGKRALLKSIYFLDADEFGNPKENVINELREYIEESDNSYFNLKILVSTFLLLGIFSIILAYLIV